MRTAEENLGSTDQELLAEAEQLRIEADELEKKQKNLNLRIRDLTRQAAKAAGVLGRRQAA